MMMVTTLLVTLIQIWVNIIYDKKSPFCEPLVFFWENTCKTSQEVWYWMVLSRIGTIEMFLGDWHSTVSELSENLKILPSSIK